MFLKINKMAILLLPLEIEVYKKMKEVKIKVGLSGLTDFDFFRYVFDCNINKDAPNIPEIKKEAEDVQPDIYSSQSNQYTKDPSSNIKSDSEEELLSQFEDNPKLPSEYHCSCGSKFRDLTLYLQHHVNCIKKDDAKLSKVGTKRKRQSETPLKIEPTVMRQRTEKVKCCNCPREFYTECALYLHDCQKDYLFHYLQQIDSGEESFQTELKELKKPLNQSMEEVTNNKIKIESKPIRLSLPLLNNELTFTCYCGEVFTDCNIYSVHQSSCGQPNINMTQYSNTPDKSAPIRALPNSNGKFDCQECTKSFTSILSLRQHSEGMHRRIPKFICKICGKAYRWCTSYHYHKGKCEAKMKMNRKV